MSRVIVAACVGVAMLAGSVASAQSTKDIKRPAAPVAQPEMELPPGMTAEDMEACMLAATPGTMHAYLAEGVGVWHGKTTMWMTPDAEPLVSECKTTIAPMMEGRYVKTKIEGDMGGMPFTGFGICGFDNVAQEFQTTWIDNCGTGMATGTGELSSDGKTMTWVLEYNCPITKKPTKMREVERRTGEDTMTFEIFGIFPKTGKEFKMMSIEYKRIGDVTETAQVGS